MAGVVVDHERARPRAWPPPEQPRSSAPPIPPAPDTRRRRPLPPGLRYRPALDGLRAVAVLAVMAEHGGLTVPGSDRPLVPGGFLGVDVFLVVSGFLITSLLLLERQRTGRIDLRAFWVRRARRLLPAVGLMVPVTCLLVALAGLPVDGATLRGDALAALAYVANWRFVVSDQSYFASFGLPSPFRHLWSLSLEEQWYLVFPPAMVALLAVLRRRTGALLAVLLGAAAASAVWMAVLSNPGQDPSRAYYGTDTRAQTLLVGAALAVVMVGLPAFTRQFARVLPALGTAGLVALGVLFATVPGERASLYHGGFLVVALAAAAVVAGVALPGATGPARWLLARRPLVAIGSISYGLYLWHWPLYVWLTPDRVGLDGPALAAVRVGASFAAAGVSYVAIEQPIRRHGLRGAARRLRHAGLPDVRPVGLATALATTVVAVVVVTTGRAGAPAAVPLADAPSTTVPVTSEPVTTTVLPPGRPLPAVPADRPLRVMVGGDSVGWSLVYPWVAAGGEPPPTSTCDWSRTSAARSRRASCSSTASSSWPTPAATGVRCGPRPRSTSSPTWSSPCGERGRCSTTATAPRCSGPARRLSRRRTSRPWRPASTSWWRWRPTPAWPS